MLAFVTALTVVLHAQRDQSSARCASSSVDSSAYRPSIASRDPARIPGAGNRPGVSWHPASPFTLSNTDACAVIILAEHIPSQSSLCLGREALPSPLALHTRRWALGRAGDAGTALIAVYAAREHKAKAGIHGAAPCRQARWRAPPSAYTAAHRRTGH